MTASTQTGRMLDDVQTVVAAQGDPWPQHHCGRFDVNRRVLVLRSRRDRVPGRVCQFGHFFASREGAEAWATKYPRGGVLTLDEALDSARALVADTFGAEDEAAG